MCRKKSMFVHKSPMQWVEVDMRALTHNYHALQSRAPRSHVMAIVKAQAYGHGMLPVAKHLFKLGVRYFGVANIAEAMDLRKALKSAKILTLGAIDREVVDDYRRHGISASLCSVSDIRLLSKNKKHPIVSAHLKVDTGMHRLGADVSEVQALLERLRYEPGVRLDGLYTHLASAEAPSRLHTQRQLDAFLKILKQIKKQYPALNVLTHTANSSACWRFPGARLDMVRPGIMLYGLDPSPERQARYKLRPMMSWYSRIWHLKTVRKGQSVGYGGTFVARRDSLLAVIPTGYSHGYRTAFSNKAFVKVRDRYCPVVGRVTMDQSIIDVTNIAKVQKYEKVCVLEATRDQSPANAYSLAEYAKSIVYEVLCGVSFRVPRLYRYK